VLSSKIAQLRHAHPNRVGLVARVASSNDSAVHSTSHQSGGAAAGFLLQATKPKNGAYFAEMLAREPGLEARILGASSERKRSSNPGATAARNRRFARFRPRGSSSRLIACQTRLRLFQAKFRGGRSARMKHKIELVPGLRVNGQ